MAYERVHIVHNYHDGPREGLADFHGQPHLFKCKWNDVSDDWAATFALSPIDEITFKLEMERWQIWREWQRAFHAGEVPRESHPGFGGKNRRYDELGDLESRLRSFEPLGILFSAKFRAMQANEEQAGGMREFEVEWAAT